MKKTVTVTIALLAATNLATAAYIWRVRAAGPEILVDHLEDMRLKTVDGTLQAKIGDSKTGSSATLIFTPHGAVQFHHELGRMFTLIEKKAAKQQPRDQPAPAESPHRSL